MNSSIYSSGSIVFNLNAEPDSLMYKELPDALDFGLNQLEKATAVRDYSFTETIKAFSEIIPYEIVTTIFNETKYIWNVLFVDKLLKVLNTGVYGNDLTFKEKELIKSYVDFKYNGTVESSDLLVSLDEFIGAM